MCVSPVGAAAPGGPLPLCVPSEAQTRGCTMARFTGRPGGMALAELRRRVPGLSFCTFLGRQEQRLGPCTRVGSNRA